MYVKPDGKGPWVHEEEQAVIAMTEKRYLVECVSASPYRKGHVEVQITDIGLRFKWHGEKEWSDVAGWAELLAATKWHNEMLRDDLKFIREDAEAKGYADGHAAGLQAAQER